MVKGRDAYKIYNSYETEPSTSGGGGSSNSNDAPSSTDSDSDFLLGHKQLRDYLYPDVLNSKQKRKSGNRKFKQSSEIRSMHKISRKKSSEFVNKSSMDTNLNDVESELRSNVACEQTFGSEEISDQDIGCRIEMKKFKNNLNCMRGNANLLSISQFSIEPSSSPSEDDTIKPTKRKPKLTDVFTLSLNEDSCNAVDVPISTRQCDETKDIIADLSFNGKISNAIFHTSAIDGNEFTANGAKGKKNTENVDANANANSRSNLEIFQLETSREKINERSPDLFADDDDEDTGIDTVYVDEKENDKQQSAYFADDSMTNQEDNETNDSVIWDRKEKATSRRIQNLLSGILPPPSVTYCQHDIASMLNLYKTNNGKIRTTIESKNDVNASEPSNRFQANEMTEIDWPNEWDSSAYGVHYNRTKYSDNIEIMYMKLAERHIGNETSSSFTLEPSMDEKKKPIRKIAVSPGNRLSHLAKRRAAFSSANLKSQNQMPNALKLGHKPCIIDASKLMKKDKPATPKRRIYGIIGRRTPGRKTPGSSKKAATNIALIIPTSSTATRETSKRALFLSPAHENVKIPKFTPEVSVRVEKSKRALFSPARRMERSISTMAYSASNSSLNDISVGMKRRREQDDENVEPQNSKMAKCQSSTTLPTRMVSMMAKASSENAMYNSHQLSASHKQKLLWSVSTALKKKSVTTSHEHFNNYASVLAKLVKRFYLEAMSSKLESTSAKMLRLADRLVFWVIQGKSVDEIYLDEKKRIEATKNATTKLSGYIGADEYAMHRNRMNEPVPSTSAARLSLDVTDSDKANADTKTSNENSISDRKPLTNSSSKNNMASSALRENHDSISAQKNPSNNISFSGRNQKNLSPYNDKARSASNLNKTTKLLVGRSLHSSLLKVKRQISFDN